MNLSGLLILESEFLIEGALFLSRIEPTFNNTFQILLMESIKRAKTIISKSFFSRLVMKIPTGASFVNVSNLLVAFLI
jgi:hypothetical protein